MSRAFLLSAAALLAFVAHLALAPVEETDLFFRLAVGGQILAHGARPGRNLFSFTHPDHPDLDPAWLFDAGAALLHRGGGFPAIVIAKTVVLVGVFALALWICRRRGAGPLASLVVLAAAALVMRERFVERPHLFSFAGVVGVMALLEVKGRAVWLAVPLTALWANLHAGAFLGPLVVGVAALGTGVDDARAGRGWGEARRLGGIAVACVPALLATPVGAGIFEYLSFHRGIFAVHPVDEFRAPTWLSDAPLLLFAIATIAAHALVRRSPGGGWRELLPVLAVGALAARSVRFGAEATLLAAPVLAARLTALTAAWSGCQALGARPGVLGGVGGALLVAAITERGAAVAGGGAAWSLDLAEGLVPRDALAFVERHGLRRRMYNEFELGGYLAWKDFPRYQVFTDPRLPAYPMEMHRLLGRADLTRPEWDAALEGYGVDSALLTHAGINHRMALWDPDRWALVYRAGDARVFVRRTLDRRAFIEEHEIPATFRFAPDTGTETVALVERPASSPVRACEWDRRLGDLYFDLDDGRMDRARPAYERALAQVDDRAQSTLAQVGCFLAADRAAATHAWLGALDLQARRFAAALVHLEAARALAPPDAALLANWALALEGLGRSADAAAAWSELARLARGTPLGNRAALRAKEPHPGWIAEP